MVLKNKNKMKTKLKTKPKPKNKQNQIQKQSQNVVVNIHETKKKHTRRKPNKKNDEKETNIGSGSSNVVYAIPDNRAIDALRGELVDTKNKLLSIMNTPNMVNMRQNGDESFSNNRLRSIEGNNRTSTTPYKIEDGKQYKSNILGDGPYIISNDFKVKRGRGRPSGVKNKAKITELTDRELRSEKAPEKELTKELTKEAEKEDLDSFVNESLFHNILEEKKAPRKKATKTK
jgi:hypothetical protein